MTDDLAFASALEQARLVREREVSPVGIVELHLERIERLNPTFNAFVAVAADEAIEAARLPRSERRSRSAGNDLSLTRLES